MSLVPEYALLPCLHQISLMRNVHSTALSASIYRLITTWARLKLNSRPTWSQFPARL